MSQFGMQMPGGRKRSSSPDVYTGLSVIATIFLAAAAFVMFNSGSRIGLDGSAWGLQDPKSIKLASSPAGAAAPAPTRPAPSPAGGAKKGG